METARLQLRRPTQEDMLVLKGLWSDAKVRQFLGGIVAPETIQEKIKSIHEHWDQHRFGMWSVYEKNLQQVIGICGLHHSEHGIEISYMVFPEFWGRGFATEASKAALCYGFNNLKLEEIVSITQEANIRSCQLLENIGMVHANDLYLFNELQRRYVLTRSEWKNKLD